MAFLAEPKTAACRHCERPFLKTSSAMIYCQREDCVESRGNRAALLVPLDGPRARHRTQALAPVLTDDRAALLIPELVEAAEAAAGRSDPGRADLARAVRRLVDPPHGIPLGREGTRRLLLAIAGASIAWASRLRKEPPASSLPAEPEAERSA